MRDEEVEEPEWSVREHVPSTWPGVRAPHVFLKDEKTSIFDFFEVLARGLHGEW